MEHNDERELLFVYGTLMQEAGSGWLAELGGKPKGKAETSPHWKLIIIGAVPAIIPGNKRIPGELWEIPKKAFILLDQYEGFYYQRRKISIIHKGKEENAWAWIWNGPLTGDEQEIPSFTQFMKKGC
ncbi:MAG: gamma-glutamylcyclotransferase [Acidobacteria bacterium]|nr:gamma-glutamylcyclotransferase [Acidobacteriota bacterium]